MFFPLLKKHKEHFSNSEISSVLYISENTVKFHVKNILKKTGCSNRNEIGHSSSPRFSGNIGRNHIYVSFRRLGFRQMRETKRN